MTAFSTMFENNAGGSTIANASSFTGWVTATAGEQDDNGFAVFSSNATADRITINRAGVYQVNFSVNFTNAGGNLTTAAIFLNGVVTGLITGMAGDSGEIRQMGTGFPVALALADFIDLRLESTSSDNIDVYQIGVSAIMIPGS